MLVIDSELRQGEFTSGDLRDRREFVDPSLVVQRRNADLHQLRRSPAPSRTLAGGPPVPLARPMGAPKMPDDRLFTVAEVAALKP